MGNGLYHKRHTEGWVVLNEKRAGKGITAEEYKEITGEEYEASEE